MSPYFYLIWNSIPCFFVSFCFLSASFRLFATVFIVYLPAEIYFISASSLSSNFLIIVNPFGFVVVNLISFLIAASFCLWLFNISITFFLLILFSYFFSFFWGYSS